MMAGTLNFGDLYGPVAPDGDKATAQNAAVISGESGLSTGNGPAISWVVLIGLLVAIRVLWEKGK